MRRVVRLSLLLGMLSACGVAEPPTAAPTAPSAQSPAYPAPIAPTPAPPQPAPATTTVPTMVANVTEINQPAPDPSITVIPTISQPLFITTTLESYVLEYPGTYVVGWSADNSKLLYTQATDRIINNEGFAVELLILFDIPTRSAKIIAEDAIYTDIHPQLKPQWNYDQNRVIYARVHDKEKKSTKDAPKIDATVDLVSINLETGEKNIIKEGISLYNMSIIYDGFFGAYIDQELIIINDKNEYKKIHPDKLLENNFSNDNEAIYHRIWIAPDTIHYAVAINHSLSIYRTDEESPLHTYTFNDSGVVHQLFWSPDSQFFYFRRWEPRPPFDFYGAYVQSIDSSTLQPLDLGLTDGVTWSADSQWLLVGTPGMNQCEGTLQGCQYQQYIVNPQSQQSQLLIQGPIGTSAQVAWSIDRKFIAYICYEQERKSTTEIGKLCIVSVKGK